MAPLSQHLGARQIRALYIGEPTMGKTGSLTSLVCAGYKLRILDFDNKLGVLRHYVNQQCPKLVDSIDAETLRDVPTATKQGIIYKSPRAFTQASELLNTWSDGSAPAQWSTDTILVVDSASAWGSAALNWATAMNPGAKDGRNWYWTAQKGIESQISLLTSEAFGPHVIVISHIKYTEDEHTNETRGYANMIGSALGPIIGRYFNVIIMAQRVGQGATMRRVIRTMPTNKIDLITPAPFSMDAELPLSSGLATIFTQLTRGEAAQGESK